MTMTTLSEKQTCARSSTFDERLSQRPGAPQLGALSVFINNGLIRNRACDEPARASVREV